MSLYLHYLRQCFFIPRPTLTEKNLPDQIGRIFIVTGGYAGVGKELSKIMYYRNGTVYIAGRSPSKAATAIDEIKAAHPDSHGRLEFLEVDLADLPSIKNAVAIFSKLETRLHVLTNNAAVMVPPVGSQTAQGYEQQMGTNVLGHWLFTYLLTPLLKHTARESPPGSVRVTWAASLATATAPVGGVSFDAQGAPEVLNDRVRDYSQSKAGNVLLARAYQARYGVDGIVSNAFNPGNLRSELQRHHTPMEAFGASFLVYDPIYGAYTELFAGWSDEAGERDNHGKYVVPWGRFGLLGEDLRDNQVQSKKLWEWCERESKAYLT